MSQFSFPILNDDELLPCMDEMELPLDAQQLAKPTYEIVRPLFEAILTSLTGVAREELNQPVFAAIDAFEYPELHDESVPCLNFFRHLGKLMAASGVKDFGLKDVHKPDSARLRRHLSAVVNFAKFREEKLVAYTEMQARIDSLLEEKRMLEEENAGKMEALDRCQAERAAEQEEASKVEAEALAIYQQNQQLNKQQLGLHSEVKALKAQANQLADQAAQQKFELMNAQQENERLQSQIVQSPEKFQRALADLQQAVEQERLLVAESERMSRDLQSKLDVVQKVEKEVSKCQRLMDELDEEVGRKKGVSRRVKELRAQISAYDHEATQLAATQQHLKRQQASLLERIQRLEHQAALKMDAAESYVEQQQKEKEMVEAENAAMDARLLENEAQMRSLSERIKELQAVHDAQVANVMDKYSGLRRTVGEYNSTLMQAVGSSRGAIALEALDVNAMVA